MNPKKNKCYKINKNCQHVRVDFMKVNSIALEQGHEDRKTMGQK